MGRFALVWIILLVIGIGYTCYMEWELKMMGDNLEIIKLHYEIVENYERRIEILENFIEYNEDIVKRAKELWDKKGMRYIKDCYAEWKDEECEDDECICRDENAYNDIWGDN